MRENLLSRFRAVKASIANSAHKVVAAVVGAGTLATPVLAFAEDTTFKDGISTLWTTLTADINIGNVVAIIGICLGACVGLALFWFGLRYVIRKLMAALKKGKVSG